jgi:enterochelin esterase-like enzyme
VDVDAPIHLPATLSGDLGSDLLASYWPSVIALVIAAALVTALVLVVRRRRRTARMGKRAAAAFAVPAALALVCALALGVNTWVGYFPSVAAVQRWLDSTPRQPVAAFPTTAVQGGTAVVPDGGPRVTTDDRGYAFLTTVPAHGRSLPDAGAWVYLPPGYDSSGNTATYPLVVALHGAPGSAADWFAGGRLDQVLDALIAAGSIPPVVVVSPDLNAGPDRVDREPLNLPGGPQIEDYVVQDVVGWADAQLRTKADPQHRVISGMSSGGLGALLYGLHHPDVFGGVVSIMPYTTPYTPEITGDPAALAANTPLEAIAARPAGGGQQFFLGQGDGEKTEQATRIRDALRAHDHPATLRVLPGLAHNWTAARTIMPYGLVWAAQRLGWATD